MADGPLAGVFARVRTAGVQAAGSRFVLAILLQALAFAATWAEAPDAFSSQDLWRIAGLGLALNAVFLSGASILPVSRTVRNAAFAAAVLAGVATTHVVHTDLYRPALGIALVLAGAAFGFAAFVAFRIVDRRRWVGAVFSLAALIGTASVVFDRARTEQRFQDWDTANVRDISFIEKPNIFFISFDGLAPPVLLEKYFDIENTEFHHLFESEFRVFRNFFAGASSTKRSFHYLLALDEGIVDQGHQKEYFSLAGATENPLYRILRRNGYSITFMYSDTYFGNFKGDHVDEYIVADFSTVCGKLDREIRGISFFGLCYIYDLLEKPANRLRAHGGAIVRRLREKTEEPQFVWTHIYTPGHTGGDFEYGDASQFEKFRTDYRRVLDGYAADLFNDIISEIEASHSDYILFVFGDHGARLSENVLLADNPTFALQDRYGVVGGFRPRARCAAEFDEAEAAGYMTILDAAHAVLRCLSGGESALRAPRKYRHVVTDHRGFRYDDILYE